MKKNILFLIVLVMAALSSCEDPQYVAPTADRQGLTSLTAIFTSGPFVDQQMARLEIRDPVPDRLVCFISPALTILDLTKENEFAYTDAQGKSKKIIITGERVKSNACELLAFSINNPEISGIIDKGAKKVLLISADDLSEAFATAEVSAHATISPDPSTTALNYNEPVTFTVTAHDGVTSCDYTVLKEVP